MAANNKRVFTREFKLTVARQLVSGEKRISQACREHSLCESVVRRWKLQYERSGENAWSPEVPTAKRAASASVSSPDEQTALTSRVQELEAALGRAHLEIEFLRLALEKKPLLPRRESR
jgi:transposase-like protein